MERRYFEILAVKLEQKVGKLDLHKKKYIKRRKEGGFSFQDDG